jgi:acyl-CoA synthetase (AMP-forming)/AMP-acid ligase II
VGWGLTDRARFLRYEQLTSSRPDDNGDGDLLDRHLIAVPTPEEIVAFPKAHLSQRGRPKTIEIMHSTLPEETGKMRRRALRAARGKGVAGW